MTYSENQVRHLYVASSVAAGAMPAAEGEIKATRTVDQKKLLINHYGKGGLTRADVIDIDSITYAKQTPAAQLSRKLKAVTVSLNSAVNTGLPVAGQDYFVNIQIKQFSALGEETTYEKQAMVHAFSGMTAQRFYEVLAESLIRNFSRDITTYFDFYLHPNTGADVLLTDVASIATAVATITGASHTVEGVVIAEHSQVSEWQRGVKALEQVNFETAFPKIVYSGDEVDGLTKTTNMAYSTIVDCYDLADLEYFLLGERADIYRQVGWPKCMPSEVMLAVGPAVQYDVIDIHHSFADTGMNNQQSEKDLTIIVPAGNTTIKAAINALLPQSKQIA